MKRTACHLILLLVLSAGLLQCASSAGTKETAAISYPSPLPDSIPLKFLPGIVCSDTLDFNACFSPDGQSFFFGRSGGGGWDIYVTRYDGKNWTQPALAPFSEKMYAEADPAFAPDGNLYYISNRPQQPGDSSKDFDIWYVRPMENGQWSEPINLKEVNSDSTEYYVAFAANGNIYFASDRPGSAGDHDLYCSKLVNGRYATPENLGPDINGPEMEHDPAVSPDEQFMIFTSVARKDGYGEGDLYYTTRDAQGKWKPAKNLGPRVNTPTYEYCSYLSPDGKYLFFSSDFDVKWIAANTFRLKD